MGRTPPGQTRARVLQFVRERIQTGLPPTIREVQQAFGFRSVQTARGHLEALVDEGRLVKEAGKSRGYRWPGSGSVRKAPPRWVPLLGAVQAGALTTAVEDFEAHVPVQDRPGEALFALRVRGESMVGAGILPGDIVIVRRQPTARSGDIVVALVEDEATVKRLCLRGRRVELRPENPHFETIVLRGTDEVRLLGKVIEVRRELEQR